MVMNKPKSSLLKRATFRGAGHHVNAISEETPHKPQNGKIELPSVGELPGSKKRIVKASPEADYLYEDRSVFTDLGTFFGGEYFLSRIPVDVEEVPDKFAYDAAISSRLVRDAIRLATGEAWLDPAYKDAGQQMKDMIDNAAAVYKKLGLAPGVELTAEQMAALTKNIVWPVTRIVDGQKVLDFVVYLADANKGNLKPGGASIVAGGSVDLEAAAIANSGNIESKNDIKLTATEGNIVNKSGIIDAEGNVALTASGDIIHTRDSYEQKANAKNIATVIRRTGEINAGGNVSLDAGKGIQVKGADIDAGGDVDLNAGEDVEISTVALRNKGEVFDDEKNYLKWDKTSHKGSNITAGGNLNIRTGKDAYIAGSSLYAEENLTVDADGNVVITSVANTATMDYKSDDGSKEIEATGQKVTNIASHLQAGGDLLIKSRNDDVIVRASMLESGGQATLDATEGSVALLSAKDVDMSTYKADSSNAVWFSTRDAGHVHETVQMVKVTADGGLVINAGNGVVVEYRDTGNLEESVEVLSKQPGLEWMAEVKERDDAVWKAVQEAHKEWDYKAEGLSGAAAAVIAIAVAIATYGAGAALVTAAVGEAAAATTMGGVAVAAAEAGIAALASQAAISMINNKGDLGAVFKEMASKETLKSLATAMVTAGLTSGVLGALNIDAGSTAFVDRLQTASTRAVVSAAVDTAINGGELGDNLIDALRGAAVGAIGGELAEQIGSLQASGDLNYVTHKLAHAVLGCAIGEAGGGDCAGGAIGGVVSEVAGEIYFSEERQLAFKEELQATLTADQTLTMADAKVMIADWQQQGMDIARLAGVLSAFAAGADVDSADTAGGNAVENNLCGTGLCIAAVAVLLSAAYATAEGDGNIIRGVDIILAGEDTLSQLTAAAVEKGIEVSYAIAPESTGATLDALAEAGQLAGQVIIFVDDASGNIVSGTWDSFSTETQQNLKRAGFFLGAAAGGGAGKVAGNVVGKLAGVRHVNLPNEVIELFSKRPSSFDPMDERQFSKIKDAFARQGKTLDDSEDALRYLETRGADGVTFNADTILVRPDASPSTVFEELIHATQHRTGRFDAWVSEYGNAGAVAKAEYEAALRLVKNKNAYGISDVEHKINVARTIQFRDELTNLGVPLD